MLGSLFPAIPPSIPPVTRAAPTTDVPSNTRVHAFRVEGMHCAGCAGSVRRAIEAVPGVGSASVDVGGGRALVRGADLDPAAIAERITASGFPAAPDEVEEDPLELRSRLEREDLRHRNAWRRRAIAAISCWIPMEALHWSGHALGHPVWLDPTLAIAGTAVLAFVGGGFYRSAFEAAKRGTSNMDTLISIGATTAWVFSVLVLFGRSRGFLEGQPTYFAEMAALLGLISLGHWLEARASAGAGAAIRELLDLQPELALRRREDGEFEEVPSSMLVSGDVVRIHPGGRVPIDGRVIEGRSALDESVLTGESLPVDRAVGDSVIAGAVNTTGSLLVEATVAGRGSTLARIARMVEEARSSRADIQRVADRVSAVFVPIVVAIALVTLGGWSLAGDPATGAISMVTVLIIACPCALGIATPLAVVVATGHAARRGILVRDAASLERAGRARQVVFDKTGTLTTGHPEVVGTETEGGRSAVDLLSIAASVEQASEHPLAKAIVASAKARGVRVRPVESFEALPGRGVRGIVEGRAVEVLRAATASCEVIVDGASWGRIDLADRPRDDARTAVDALRTLGLEVSMLSGDRRSRALEIAEAVGIDAANVEADADPERKRVVIAERGAGTVMVGDGINDAAALAGAEVGLAMASGTTVAIESAGIVVPGDRTTSIPETVRIARMALSTIRQNLFLAFAYNASMIPVAAFGLLGVHGPLIAAGAMALSDLSVVGNALRLRRRFRRGEARSSTPRPDQAPATSGSGQASVA